jgi:hypothetical protein
MGQNRSKELSRNVTLKQPVPVLREHRMVPGRIVDADPDKPAKQEIIFQPLHQQPFRADRVECLQKHRPQELLRRDRGSPNWRIKRREIRRQHRQRLVHDPPDRAERMVSPNPRLKIHVAEQFASPTIAAPHDSSSESLQRT